MLKPHIRMRNGYWQVAAFQSTDQYLLAQANGYVHKMNIEIDGIKMLKAQIDNELALFKAGYMPRKRIPMGFAFSIPVYPHGGYVR